MPTFGVKATPKIDSRSRFTRRRKDHVATLDGVGPRFLSRRVFLVLDGPIAAATAAGKQRDGYVVSRRVLVSEPDFG